MSEQDEPKKKKPELEGQAYEFKDKSKKKRAVKASKETPKSVMPEYFGPKKVPGKFDAWFENRGKQSVMHRGYNIRPGDGAWVASGSKAALEAACGMKKAKKSGK